MSNEENVKYHSHETLIYQEKVLWHSRAASYFSGM